MDKGYAKFLVHHDEEIENILSSTKKLNDGTNYKVEITMQYKNPQQQYNLIIRNDEEDVSKVSSSKKLPNSKVIKIREANHFVGGVPPTFNKSCVPFTTTSLLGYLDLENPLINEAASYGFTNINKKVRHIDIYLVEKIIIYLFLDFGIF